MPNVNKKYELVFDTRIAGIPCQIGVTYFHNQPRWGGCAHTCDSDVDYYGCHESEYDVLDRRGRPAAWLERKLTDDIKSEIDQETFQLFVNGMKN
jgi:hypothetical protein